MTQPNSEIAILAGGCFWGMQDLIRNLKGVIKTQVGYTGGELSNPTYPDVKTGMTGHAEAIEIEFDPAQLSYETVLELFFQIHDPTTLNRQGNDRGSQYRSEIFVTSFAQEETAQAMIAAINESGQWPGPVVTAISWAREFYPAEEFHQDYLEKHPNGYTCHFPRKDWVLKNARNS